MVLLRGQLVCVETLLAGTPLAVTHVQCPLRNGSTRHDSACVHNASHQSGIALSMPYGAGVSIGLLHMCNSFHTLSIMSGCGYNS